MMEKLTDKRKVCAALRSLLYELTLKKPSTEDRYEMLRRYDKRIDIQKPGEPWNVVDLTQCNDGVIYQAKIKAEARLKELS